MYMYIHIYTSVDLCIYMHRESGSDSEVDAIVKLIWSKVWITKAITISITSLIAIVAQVCRGSYRSVPGTIHCVQGKLSWRTWHHNCGSGVQGKLSQRTWHYPLCTGEAIVAYLALCKGGSRVHYPRVAIIQGWIWGPLSKGGHYPRVDHGSTIQGWPLSKCGHYHPRVATVEESGKWQLLSKALLNIREATWTLSSQGDQRAPIENFCIDVHIACIVCKHAWYSACTCLYSYKDFATLA